MNSSRAMQQGGRKLVGFLVGLGSNLALLVLVVFCAGLTGISAITDSGPEISRISNRSIWSLCLPALLNFAGLAVIAVMRKRDLFLGAAFGGLAGMFWCQSHSSSSTVFSCDNIILNTAKP